MTITVVTSRNAPGGLLLASSKYYLFRFRFQNLSQNRRSITFDHIRNLTMELSSMPQVSFKIITLIVVAVSGVYQLLGGKIT